MKKSERPYLSSKDREVWKAIEDHEKRLYELEDNFRHVIGLIKKLEEDKPEEVKHKKAPPEEGKPGEDKKKK